MVDVDIIEIHAQYIYAKVKDRFSNKSFYATFVYGLNKVEEREPLWEGLIRLTVQDPWILLGDFNNVMYANERIGGEVRDQEVIPFQDTANDCELQDLKSYGAFFTWNNKQSSATRVFSRIDRVMVNDCWLNEWSDYYAQFNPEGEFDHCPCLISDGVQKEMKKRAFKFFNMWCRAPEYNQTVKENWDSPIYGTAMFKVCKKLKMMKPALKKLNGSLFSGIERNADIAYQIMIDAQKQLQRDPYNC
ncbi:uncharacterized protein LOC141601668 [Silene latifolia]|uniref:uncharacterized protein LOC141601668 n=1 Tax=Silene latifolia TaxID=37657 RepID=UPI003D76B165